MVGAVLAGTAHQHEHGHFEGLDLFGEVGGVDGVNDGLQVVHIEVAGEGGRFELGDAVADGAVHVLLAATDPLGGFGQGHIAEVAHQIDVSGRLLARGLGVDERGEGDEAFHPVGKARRHGDGDGRAGGCAPYMHFVQAQVVEHQQHVVDHAVEGEWFGELAGGVAAAAVVPIDHLDFVRQQRADGVELIVDQPPAAGEHNRLAFAGDLVPDLCAVIVHMRHGASPEVFLISYRPRTVGERRQNEFACRTGVHVAVKRVTKRFVLGRCAKRNMKPQLQPESSLTRRQEGQR